MPPRDVKKILILRFSSLGDIVMATPLVRCLRRTFPLAQIDMVVREDFLDLISENPHLDQKIGLARKAGFSGLFRLLKQINRERYDLVYDAHRSLRTRFLMPLISADHKVYYQKNYLKRALALTFKLRLLDSKRMLERYLEPLRPFGVEWDRKGPEVFVPEALSNKVDLGRSKGLTIGFIPSAQWPGKRWPAECFRDLALKIVSETEHNILIFGGKDDHFCKTIGDGLPSDRVINKQGVLSILESAAWVKKCDLVVANDTGLMHVADAVGVPSYLIFGPTSKEMGCLPFHPQSVIFEQELWCRPCSKNGQAPCIRGRRVCLERTTAECVFSAIVTRNRF